jgi:hypothetical protein
MPCRATKADQAEIGSPTDAAKLTRVIQKRKDADRLIVSRRRSR